jgi:uncharacterized protein YdaL
MAYIYWLPALLGYLSVVVFASIESFQTTQLEKSERACVQIYHDRNEQRAPQVLKNLMDSFGTKQAQVADVDFYQTGDLDRCAINFYIGTEIDNKLPKSFLTDYFQSRQKVIWIGYNIWQVGDQLEQKMGLRVLRIAHADSDSTGNSFRDILYRGQVFAKSSNHSVQVELVPTDLLKFEALAEIRHSRSREVIPYIVRSENRFYVADNPFEKSGIKDVGFVFTNVLGEILGLQHFPQAQYGIR